MSRLARRLLPPLSLTCLAASALLWPAGTVVAQHVDPEPSPASPPEIDIRCERLGIHYIMAGWTIYGTCEYRMCRFVDEDGYNWTLGGAPIVYFEVDCGPLGTHVLSDDTPGAS